MSPIVQKFGGSSLASTDHIARVADTLARRCADGHELVVVASAMGGQTDRLVGLADDLHPEATGRELDALLSTGESISTALLALALQARDIEAVSLRGWQAGIRTVGPHNHAYIDRVDPSELRAQLAQGRLPVVCGFQGIDAHGQITTLGRGGSDTTAVAIAAALGGQCEIFSDVDGVYSADPRMVANARRLDEISHDVMLAFAQQGAGVLNEDAVAHAQRLGVTLRAASTFVPGPGTLVGPECSRGVVGVAVREEAYRVAGPHDSIQEIVDANHLVAERANGRREAIVVLNPGASLDDLDGLARPVATVGLVGRDVSRFVQEGSRALTRANIELEDVFVGPAAITFVLSPKRAAGAARVLHATLLETKRSESEVRPRA